MPKYADTAEVEASRERADLEDHKALRLAKGVLFDPSSAFCAEPDTLPRPCLRLGFGSIAQELIAPGIRELGLVINAHAKRPAVVRG